MRRLAITANKTPRNLVPIIPASYEGEPLYTVQEVAGILHVPVQTIRSWLHRRWMTHLRFGRRTIRVSQSEIDRFRDQMTRPRVVERSDEEAPEAEQEKPLKKANGRAVKQ